MIIISFYTKLYKIIQYKRRETEFCFKLLGTEIFVCHVRYSIQINTFFSIFFIYIKIMVFHWLLNKILHSLLLLHFHAIESTILIYGVAVMIAPVIAPACLHIKAICTPPKLMVLFPQSFILLLEQRMDICWLFWW